MVVHMESDDRIVVFVDSGRPNAWREHPYYAEIKEWSALGLENRTHILVCVGGRSIVIFPDHDVDVGHVADDERIVTVVEPGPFRSRWHAIKMKAADPRIAKM
jgi:hypothetical protein